MLGRLSTAEQSEPFGKPQKSSVSAILVRSPDSGSRVSLVPCYRAGSGRGVNFKRRHPRRRDTSFVNERVKKQCCFQWTNWTGSKLRRCSLFLNPNRIPTRPVVHSTHFQLQTGRDRICKYLPCSQVAWFYQRSAVRIAFAVYLKGQDRYYDCLNDRQIFCPGRLYFFTCFFQTSFFSSFIFRGKFRCFFSYAHKNFLIFYKVTQQHFLNHIWNKNISFNFQCTINAGLFFT